MANDKQEPTAINAIAEAVKGLARDRTALQLGMSPKVLNYQWTGFDAFKKETESQIAAIDARIDKLLELETARMRASLVSVNVEKYKPAEPETHHPF